MSNIFVPEILVWGLHTL